MFADVADKPTSASACARCRAGHEAGFELDGAFAHDCPVA